MTYEVPSFWAKFGVNFPFAPKGNFFRKFKFIFVDLLCPVMLHFKKILRADHDI